MSCILSETIFFHKMKFHFIKKPYFVHYFKKCVIIIFTFIFILLNDKVKFFILQNFCFYKN